MQTEALPVIAHARITVRKYLGDPPQPGEVKEPVETLVIQDGVIVERTIHSQEVADVPH